MLLSFIDNGSYRSTFLLSKEKGIDPIADGRLELNFRFVGKNYSRKLLLLLLF